MLLFRVREMAQGIKILATEPEYLNTWIPGIHTLERTDLHIHIRQVSINKLIK